MTYQGEKGGGGAPSWMAVAQLQRDLYRAVKSDPVIAKYPVWSISEGGAEKDNVGLQFLTIPAAFTRSAVPSVPRSRPSDPVDPRYSTFCRAARNPQ